MNSLQKPDSPALFLESGKGHAARWPLADIDDRWRTGWGSPRAFGVIAGYLPSAILILPKPVSRSPPKTSSIYPSSISRALCSAGMRCIKPLAPSRNETNSSRVNAGADKTWAIARLCAYGWPVQANQPATIKPTHYLDDEGLASFAQKKRPQRGAELRPWRLGSFVPVCPGTILSSLTGLKSVPSPTSLAALRTRCGHFAFAFTRNRERPSAIRRAWARALTATTVRPRSAAMSKTEALEMTSSRSRLSSSDVQAFALFIFFASFLRGHARFRALDAAGLSLFASALPACLPLMSSNISFCPAAACGFLPTMV
jgi:hypothetical protein